ncbi:MAG: vWA domain-containing protein, partial [Planctomycetota bacterium]
MALLIILACLRPGCEGTELQGERFIFLIDQSASMSATDVGEGTRLSEAKRRISQMLDRMKPSDSAMLISFSNQAEVVQSYTRNKSQLKKKLESISQTERATDLTEALVAASGLANPGRTSTEETDIQVADSLPAKLMIYSDGGVTSVPD